MNNNTKKEPNGGVPPIYLINTNSPEKLREFTKPIGKRLSIQNILEKKRTEQNFISKN